MSGQNLWNPTAKPDNAERPDISGLRSDMSGQSLWNPAAKPDKAERTDMSVLGGQICPARVFGIRLWCQICLV
jgi:hypothetical protein